MIVFLHPFIFFFNDPPPPEIYTFPYTTLFRSPAMLNWRSAATSWVRSNETPAVWSLGAPVMPLAATVLASVRSEEHTSELQSHVNLVCRLLLEKKKKHSDKRRSTSISS